MRTVITINFTINVAVFTFLMYIEGFVDRNEPVPTDLLVWPAILLLISMVNNVFSFIFSEDL